MTSMKKVMDRNSSSNHTTERASKAAAHALGPFPEKAKQRCCEVRLQSLVDFDCCTTDLLTCKCTCPHGLIFHQSYVLAILCSYPGLRFTYQNVAGSFPLRNDGTPLLNLWTTQLQPRKALLQSVASLWM